MSSLPRMKPIVPWWQLATLLVLCAVGVYVLLPDDPKLVDNLIRDRNTRDARRVLERVSSAERARDPARYRLLELKLARLELPPADAPLAARSAALQTYWSQAIETWRQGNFASDVFAEFAPIIPQLNDPGAAWALVAPHFDAAPPEQRAALVNAFTAAALAHNQPAIAAEIFARGHAVASRTPAQALELARLWQLAGRPADALAALGELRTPEIETRRLELLRSLNRNREALELLRTRLDSTPSAVIDAKAANEIAELALAAGAPAEAVAIYQRYVTRNPDHLAALRRLRELLLAAGRPADALDPARRAMEVGQRQTDDLLSLARILEWSSRAGEAFDLWSELALRQVPGALDRVLALNPGLFRDADLARVLEQTVAAAPREDHLLALARLNVDLGRYGPAVTAFERYLRSKNDSAVMLELARVHRENFDFAAAETWLRRAASDRPDDLDLRRELAELLVYQKRHADALGIYGELVQQSGAEEIIGPFTRLAESLGRFDEFARGLQRRVDASREPTERDYILLAYAHELAANPAGRRNALAQGLKRHPASDDLRLQYAYLLAAGRHYLEAQTTLAAHTRLREDLGATTLYLDLLRLNNDTAAERRFLAQPISPSIADDESVLERLGRAYEALRDYPEAERLWRRLYQRDPDNVTRVADLARVLLVRNNAAEAQGLLQPFLSEPAPATLKLAAEVASAAGDHRAAEEYQLGYLRAVRDASAHEWGALGDIRLNRGDRVGAEQAYREALRRLHTKMARKGTP